VRFLVDAQMPRRLCVVLRAAGYDAIHTSDLPDGNRTPDQVINALSLADERVVITKDTDFYYSHLLHRGPFKLLLVKTGNMRAGDLCRLIERQLEAVVAALEEHSLVEIDQAAVRVSEPD
jgi:predicted nuclease of predicted toxin-antitoxin system